MLTGRYGFRTGVGHLANNNGGGLPNSEFTIPEALDANANLGYSHACIGKWHLSDRTNGGMNHPNMATMLSVICTDIQIGRKSLQGIGENACHRSFNSISIDGDTSTNDSLAILANGAAAPSSESSIHTPEDWSYFKDQVQTVAEDLAKLVVRDGEGATKFVSLHVRGASSHVATLVGRTIAVSPLVKTALYGKDANWGRILCAIGNVDSPHIDPKRTSVAFGVPGGDGSERLQLIKRGQPLLPRDEDLAKKVLEEEDVHIYIDLHDVAGTKQWGGATVWTCDFSHEYVTINGDYRT